MLNGQVNASRLRRNVRAADESGGEASPRISVVENAAGRSTEGSKRAGLEGLQRLDHATVAIDLVLEEVDPVIHHHAVGS